MNETIQKIDLYKEIEKKKEAISNIIESRKLKTNEEIENLEEYKEYLSLIKKINELYKQKYENK